LTNPCPEGREHKLLPVRIKKCKRPGLLKGVTGFDLFGLDEAAARELLLASVAAAAGTRAKPGVKPGFPGAGRAVPAAPRFPGAGPRVWNVPPHNPHFTGRGAELADLARGLTGGSAVTVHSVHGLGGVGKTQLAAEYAHARAADYEVAWWVAAEEASLIPDQFAGLARRLGLDPATEPDLVRAQVHDRLREVAGWLLVFDNADDADGIRSWLPAAPQPFGVPGHVLVTRPLLERALAITETAYGPDHPSVATCLNNLALTLQHLGEPGTGPATARPGCGD
jgi:hypothetical protein